MEWNVREQNKKYISHKIWNNKLVKIVKILPLGWLTTWISVLLLQVMPCFLFERILLQGSWKNWVAVTILPYNCGQNVEFIIIIITWFESESRYSSFIGIIYFRHHICLFYVENKISESFIVEKGLRQGSFIYPTEICR